MSDSLLWMISFVLDCIGRDMVHPIQMMLHHTPNKLSSIRLQIQEHAISPVCYR